MVTKKPQRFWIAYVALLFAPVAVWPVCGQLASAQTAPVEMNEFVGRVWQVEDGLPQNSVMAILQSKDGYLWLGTANGLARFDGVRFKVFGLADGLPSPQVRVLLEDRDGAIWIGTGNGLSRYRDGEFTTWTTRDGLAGDGIMGLTQDREGNVWVGTTTGLSQWRNGVIKNLGTSEVVAGRYVRALFADRQGVVWVSIAGVGLRRWDGRQFAPLDELAGTPSLAPYCLLEDRKGRLWAAVVGRVLCLENGVWMSYGAEQGLPRVRITALTEDAGGNIWAGTYDQGLYHLREGRFHRVIPPNGLSDEAVQAVLEDREKNIWVGTRAGGLNRLKDRQLSMWTIRDGETEVAPMSLAESPDGVLWVASLGRGFYRFEHGMDSEYVRESPSGYLPFGALLIRRDGRLWWGTESRLAQWQDGRLGTPVGSVEWLRGDAVRCLWEDRDDGLWVGTRGGRLWLHRTESLTEFTNGVPRAALTALAQQRDGTLWVGSYGGGLGRLQGGQGTVFGREQGLRSDLIRALHLDAKENLWIGTEGGGLSCFQEGVIHSFGAQHGLNDTVVQILEDDAGHLWLGTFHGILQVFRRDLEDLLEGRVERVHPRVLGRSDGMVSEQCAVGFGTSLKTRAGILCFSTDRGIAVIDPRVRGSRGVVPDVKLDEVWVDGLPQPLPGRRIKSGNGTRTASTELVIPPGRRRVEIRYTGLYYSAPERVRFRYRLAGLDSEWIESGAERVAPYTHLPPGRYRFEVAAHNGNGVWTQPPVTLAIVALPHFWQTWWFRLLLWVTAVTLVGGGVAAILRRRHQVRLRAVEQQHAMERERARIAQDLHDDLGSSLTEIGFLSTLVRSPSLPAVEAGQYLSQITEKSRELVKALDEIVWAVNPRNDSLSNAVNYLCLFAEELLQAAAIRCRLDVPAELPSRALTAEQRHNLFLAVKEALVNAAKHGAATEVTLRFEWAATVLTITIADNGQGFDPATVPPGRNGLTNLKARMAGLRGECQVASIPGAGTVVRLRLPVP